VLTLALSVLAVLIASALSSGSEVALLSASYGDVLSAVQEKRRGAKGLKAIKDDVSRALMAIVIWNNVANIVGSIAVGAIAAQHFDSQGVGIFSGVLTLLVIIFAEIIPKTLGERYALAIALAIAPVVRMLGLALLPAILLIELLVKPFARNEPISTSEAEINALTRLGASVGAIEADEGEMIHRIFRLNDVTAWDIMTPMGRIDALREHQKVGELHDFAVRVSHSRIPVLGEEPNTVMGLIHVRSIFEALAAGEGDQTVGALCHPVDFVPSTMRCDDMLRHFQFTRRHLSMVVDPLGTLLGLVTMEDVVEEIVGEIKDETDKEDRLVRRLSRTEVLVEASAELAEVNRYFKVDLPGSGRVGDLVIDQLGRIPEVGESFEAGGVTVVVEVASPQMVERVRIRKPTSNNPSTD